MSLNSILGAILTYMNVENCWLIWFEISNRLDLPISNECPWFVCLIIQASSKRH